MAIWKLRHLLTITLVLLILSGCSGSSYRDPASPLTPDSDKLAGDSFSDQFLWGLYDIKFDQETLQAEIKPLRNPSVELNVLKFLEPSAGSSFISITDLEFSPPLVNFTMGINHPFSGRADLTGFSVRGVVLTDGSLGSFENPAIVTSGSGELKLLNYDGFTRWMNPVEFPFDGTVFGYHPGAMGHTGGADFGSTLNPYKLFADGLDQVSDNLDLNESKKSAFTSDSTNYRRYELDFGMQEPLHFQYAVIAGWAPPYSNPPQIPDDFPKGTVASEPWKIQTTEQTNTLYYLDGVTGGKLILGVEIADFEDGHEDRVYVEAPGIFPYQEMTLISQDGIYLSYELHVAEIILAGVDPFDVLITAVATDGKGFDGLLPGEELATYSFLTVEPVIDPTVLDCPKFPFIDDFQSYDCEWTSMGGDWWGVNDGILDASNGGDCYEEENGDFIQNFNVSSVISPLVEIPSSDKDLLLRFNHMIDIDTKDPAHKWAWDLCYVKVNGEQAFPEGEPEYELNKIPLSYNPFWCWTGFYDWTESTFNLGTEYNGKAVRVEFVLDTYDYITNCNPPNEGWLIDDVRLEFAD